MVTRKSMLVVLSRARLIEIAKRHDLPVTTATGKQNLIDTLARCRVFTTVELLQSFTRCELKLACRRNEQNDLGRDRATLIARLSGDDRVLIKHRVVSSLKAQGFVVQGPRITLPADLDKEAIRQLHSAAVRHKRERAEPQLRRHETRLLNRIARGNEVQVDSIQPRLVEVTRGSEEELLFRYVCLHWSIPVSSGYGRRLRLLVIDESNNKVIGIVGLGDPVFALSPRDRWIGWNHQERLQRLHNVVDAFALGAVPPYSYLLGGKLVAMLAVSNESRSMFQTKYGGTRTLIGGRTVSGDVALMTTTSALGRSSIYNRLTYAGRTMYNHVGFTRGYGDFQFLNGLYDELSLFAGNRCEPTAKKELWGTGFRNRREVVKKCLTQLGLSSELLCHGIQREVFVVPLAENTKGFLQGKAELLTYYNQPVDDLFRAFRERWLLPRASRNDSFQEFDNQAYRLWNY